MTDGRRCWYCGSVGMPLTDEHVLSEANFGGRLVARDAVCGRCNRMVGALERAITRDAFLSYLVGQYAPAYAPRGGPRPMADGVLEDGTPVRVAFTPDGPCIASREPRCAEVRADGTEVWDVLVDDEERVRERLAKKGIRATVMPHERSETTGLNIKWGIGPPNIANWSRLCAKVALSLASLVLDPAWLDTPGAKALQDVLHERPWDAAVLGRHLPFGPGSADPDDEPASLLAATDHAVGLDHDTDGAPRAFMFLFGGEILIALPIPDAPVPDDERIWLVPAGGTPHGPLSGLAMLECLRTRR